MTARQRQIHQQVMAVRDELVPLAAGLPVGFCITAQLAAEFVPYGYARPKRVTLQRWPDAVAYREDTPAARGFKGYALPRWRILARVEPAKSPLMRS